MRFMGRNGKHDSDRDILSFQESEDAQCQR